MKNIIENLQSYASGRLVLMLFILTMGVYAFMLFYTLPNVERFAPGIALFDMSPNGYSYQHANSLLETLGEAGRKVYLSQQLPADFIYPGLFAVSFSLLLIWIFAKGFESKSKIFFLAMVPALAGLFDYLENIGIIFMIQSYPNLSQGLVSLASSLTILKSVFTTGFFILLTVGIIAVAVRQIRKKF